MPRTALQLACAAATVLAPAPAPGQRSAAELARELHDNAVEVRDLTARLRQLRSEATSRADASLEVDGWTVRYASSDLRPRELRSVRAGLVRAQETLARVAGAEATTLTSEVPWVLTPVTVARRRRLTITIGTGTAQFGPRVSAAEVSRLALGQATRRLAALHPALDAGSATTPIGSTADILARTAELLAQAPSASANRCGAGSVASCRTLLSPLPAGRSPLTTWYDIENHRMLVRRAVSTEGGRRRVNASAEEREACLVRNETDACTRIAQTLRIGHPLPAAVHDGLTLHALDIGGAAGLRRLRALPHGPQITNLAAWAALSGLSEDSLLASWHAALRTASAHERRNVAPLTLSTLGWCALLLVVAMRRRPR